MEQGNGQQLRLLIYEIYQWLHSIKLSKQLVYIVKTESSTDTQNLRTIKSVSRNNKTMHTNFKNNETTCTALQYNMWKICEDDGNEQRRNVNWERPKKSVRLVGGGKLIL